MKIALIHRYYGMPGGVTTVVRDLKSGLEKRGHEVKILSASNHDNEENVISLGSGTRFYFKLLRTLKREKFDIIHTHSVPVSLMKPIIDTKIVLTIHGYEKMFDRPKGLKRFYINLINFSKIWGYRLSDHLIAVSKLIKEDVCKNYNINSNKIDTIFNIVNIERFKEYHVKRDKKEFRIFSYGISNRKGFPLILKMAENLSKKYKNFKFVIAGGTPIIQESLKKYFEFHDFIKLEDMPKLYNSVDMVILPSIYDPFGLTAVEGMACGKPAIVSTNSGVKDLIVSGKNGIISNLDDFEKNIIFLMENKKDRIKMGIEGKKSLKNISNNAKFIKEHESVYSNLKKDIKG